MKKEKLLVKTLSFAAVAAMTVVLGGVVTTVQAAESESYTGEIREYTLVDKELWWDTTLYGGYYDAARIVAGNGDETFDIDAFINSELGELVLERIQYELCTVGDTQWGSDYIINYWAEQGVTEEIHIQGGGDTSEIDPTDSSTLTDVYLTFMPNYMEMVEDGDEETYPLVIDYHGLGGSLFESIDHGFVHICYEND